MLTDEAPETSSLTRLQRLIHQLEDGDPREAWLRITENSASLLRAACIRAVVNIDETTELAALAESLEQAWGIAHRPQRTTTVGFEATRAAANILSPDVAVDYGRLDRAFNGCLSACRAAGCRGPTGLGCLFGVPGGRRDGLERRWQSRGAAVARLELG